MRKLFLFNPTNEIAVFNDTVSYTPPAFLRKFERDVAPLLGFAGDVSDILIADNSYSEVFRQYWKGLGVELPVIVSKEKIPDLQVDGTLFPVPWGWNRSVHRLLSPLKPYYDPSFTGSPNFEWKEHYRDFFSRDTSVRFMNEVRERTSGHEFISIPYSPDVVTDSSELEEWIGKNAPPYVFKTPYGSSGRGLYPVPDEEFVTRCRVWVDSRLKQQKKLIIEPWLNKKQDLSFQFYIHADGRVDFLGVNFFEAGRQGEFMKEFVGIPLELENRLRSFSFPADWVAQTEEVLTEVLKQNNFHQNYCGPIGIDGIFFEDASGQIKLHPCIEINFRLNMGYVNLKIKDILHPEAKGEWTIRQFKPGEWNRFAAEGLKAFPPQKLDGKILKGFLPLVPWGKEQLYGVWAEMG